ncbi:MAG: type II secretion system F family protein [Candidatus Omnitrophica bacterium]|nr:type II secretion system F family protein [Candidatus Omnitrophota bacterium]
MTIVTGVLTATVVIILMLIAFYFWSNYHISKKEISILARQMSIMLDAGIPLLRVFKILSERISHPRLRVVVREIHDSVEQGNTVAAAMANHPDVFDDVMIGVVKVGETGGILDESMRRLADHLEKWTELRRKVILAWIYPSLVIVVMTAVVVTLVVFFVPNVIDPLLELNPNLEVPWITAMVAGMGKFIIGNWLLLLVGIGAAIVAIVLIRRTMAVRVFEDYLRLHFPGLGNLLGKRIAAASSAGMFSTLVHCGIPIISCLRILSQTQPNYYVSRCFRRTAQEVEEGGSLVKPIEESNVFPPLMVDMLAIGDESGTLDTVLDKIADNFNKEVDSALDAFTRILEALVMLMVGIIVLVVALAAYLPYFTMYTKIDG